jgi:hypothetical protein
VTSNPLVASRTAAPVDPWAGVWIAEDIELLARGVRGGNWVEATLGGVSAGLDVLAMVTDPVGALLQYGVAWIIEHVRPLSQALDWLAGDPAQIAAHAQTWRNVAAAMSERGADLARLVRWDTTDWHGRAAEAYRGWAGQQQGAIAGLATAADTMAAITEGAGMLVAGVRLLVRDAIATLVSRLVVYAAEEVASLGLATPLVVGQVTSLVASWAAKIARWLKALLASLRRLQAIIHRLGELIEELKKILNRLHRSGTPGAPEPPKPTKIDRRQVTPNQAANLARFEKKLPAGAEETSLTRLADGSITMEAKVPGRVPGSYALYTKTIDEAGNTITYTKTTVAPDGSVVHVKEKFNR